MYGTAKKSRCSAIIFFSNSAIGLFIGRRMVMHVVLQRLSIIKTEVI